MARLARVVVPGFPHHIIQRGNRRQAVFFQEADYRTYTRLLAEACRTWQVQVWAYCLMTNHVHAILVPATAEGLREAVSQTHARYTRHINFREGWRGYLWQGRFRSYVMDAAHLLAAARYIELNPVTAGMVASPEAYPWSSARAHLAGQDDELVSVRPLLRLVPDWRGWLAGGMAAEERCRIERHGRAGRPAGDLRFVHQVEQLTGRVLRRGKPGPKPALN